MSIDPVGCRHCLELEAELRRARGLLEQCLAQTRVAMGNQAIAERAILAFLDSTSPEESALRAV